MILPRFFSSPKKQWGRLITVLLVGLVGYGWFYLVPSNVKTPQVLPAAPAIESLPTLPLAFVSIPGQGYDGARYQARTPYGVLLFAPEQIELMLKDDESRAVTGIGLRFVGGNPRPRFVADAPLPGHVSYFIGGNPVHWQTNLPTYGQVIYEDLYPHINLVYNGTQQSLKGTYVVAPGGNPGHIRWQYDGVGRVMIDPGTGDLHIYLDAADNHPVLVERAPQVWQTIAGEKVPVSARYVLDTAEQQVGGTAAIISFALGNYDPAHPLIVDPVIDFGSHLGGSLTDGARAVALDDAGNIYVAGYTESADLPNAGGNLGGSRDIFVTKINAAQTAVLYTLYYGGTDAEADDLFTRVEVSLAVDRNQHVYLAGKTRSLDLPVVNAFQGSKPGGDDSFITKIDSSGSVLLYSTYLGGSDDDVIYGLDVDAAGNAYVAGYTDSHASFPTTAGSLKPTTNTDSGFVTKLSSSGNQLVYSTFIPGTFQARANDIAVDNAGNAYITGNTGPNFPATANAPQPNGTSNSAFVLKLDPTGSTALFSTPYGGSIYGAEGYAIAVDETGNVYLTGDTTAEDFPTVNAIQPDLSGREGFRPDAFIVKMNTNTGQVAYSTYLGGTGNDYGYGIAIDNLGQAYVTGRTDEDDFPVQNSLQTLTGFSDAFVAKIAADGKRLQYSTLLGGNESFIGDEGGYAIAADAAGNAYVVGETWTTTSFPTVNPLQGPTNNNYGDAFIVVIDDALVFAVDPTAGAVLTTTQSLTITIPPNAFSGGTSDFRLGPLRVAAAFPPGLRDVSGSAFRLTPYRDGSPVTPFSLDEPLTIDLAYQEAAVFGAEDSLRLYTAEAGSNQWQPAADTCTGPNVRETRNTQANRLTVNVCHLSEFVVLAEANPLFLPLVIRR